MRNMEVKTHNASQTGPGGLPAKQGLYDPQFEHDACGLGFVVNIKGKKSVRNPWCFRSWIICFSATEFP